MSGVSVVRGVWTYRSFLNEPGYSEDISKLAVWEAELSFAIGENGRLYGFLGERPAVATGSDPYLLVEGQVSDGDPIKVSWRAKGRPGTAFEGWVYDYVGYVVPDWEDATRPRAVITGTVTRTVAHGQAPAGSVFSFYAVKQDYVEPRIAIPLAKPVVDMMASAEHRHHHALWHASRDEWGSLGETKREALRALGWQPGPNGDERSSRTPDRLTNGSGEDFFFMHRRMVRDVRNLDPGVRTWRTLPSPVFPVSFNAEFKATAAGNSDGFGVPDAWITPGDPDTTNWLFELRKTSTFYGKFQAWEAQFTDPKYLAAVSLSELGSRIEMTIHNWMHMRWASIPRDPSPDPFKHGKPIPEGRGALDFDAKWLAPEYDYLGETFSSHVNPVFWRLHGWVDDRIEDWFKAQEAVRPGVVKRKLVQGVEWFEADGQWVLVDVPWEGLRDPHSAHHGANHGGLLLDVPAMQKALAIIYGPEPLLQPKALAEHATLAVRPMATWFKRVDF